MLPVCSNLFTIRNSLKYLLMNPNTYIHPSLEIALIQGEWPEKPEGYDSYSGIVDTRSTLNLRAYREYDEKIQRLKAGFSSG